MNRNGLNYVKAKTCILYLRFQPGNALTAPNLTHRHIINCCNDGLHTWDLADVLQGHFIIFPVPSE